MGCNNNFKTLPTTKAGFQCLQYGYLKMYRGEDYIPKFGESLREHAMKIINFEKKNVIPLTNNQQKLDEKTRICYICKKKKV